ncbi:hypothetical protein [Micromonospora sp. LOL_023]|uniref:hypothetical protein n=1 Tax=Micromonospora sp. LOL_023 TaxID=3345418 RepID=UPI003A851C10
MDSPYGAQWVGPAGGTGRQQEARRVTLAEGETKRVSRVLLDPRATISGWVFSYRGSTWVSIAASNPDIQNDPRETQVRPDGTFEIDWVGPYEWPLLFRLERGSMQWSGWIGNRLLAETVPAGSAERFEFYPSAGQEARTFVHPAQGAPPCSQLRVFFRNVATRDVMGGSGSTFLLTGGQQIKVEYQCDGETRWYGGTDFDTATPVVVKYWDWIRLSLP